MRIDDVASNICQVLPPGGVRAQSLRREDREAQHPSEPTSAASATACAATAGLARISVTS